MGPDASLRDVGRLFVEHEGLKSVPVLDQENNIVGIITVGDLAKRYYNELSIQDLDDGETDYRSIVHTLDGQLICGDLTHTFNGKIKIGLRSLKLLARQLKMEIWLSSVTELRRSWQYWSWRRRFDSDAGYGNNANRTADGPAL